MTTTVYFPGLGLSFDISRVAFTLFGIDVYWYGVLIGIGMALAVLMAFSQANKFGIDVDRMIDVIFIGFILAIVCGRLYYVLFVDASYRTFFELIDLRSGGIAIYGGIIGAVLGAYIGCRWRKVPLLPMLDLTSMGFLIGQAIGRWGNFFNQEAFGNNTDGILGMISQNTHDYLTYNASWLSGHGQYVDPNMPVHPTFLYESIWCAVGFVLLWLYRNRRRFNGELALMYVMWYGTGRFFIEGLRTDSLWIGGVRVSQLLAAVSALAAFAVWLYARRKFKGQPLQVPEIPPRTARVQLSTEEGEEWVTISWPADQRTPTKEEQRDLARRVLAAEKAEKAEKADGDGEEPKDADADEAAKKADGEAGEKADGPAEDSGQEAEAETETEAEPEADAETEPEAETDAEAEPETDGGDDASADGKAEPKSKKDD